MSVISFGAASHFSITDARYSSWGTCFQCLVEINCREIFVIYIMNRSFCDWEPILIERLRPFYICKCTSRMTEPLRELSFLGQIPNALLFWHSTFPVSEHLNITLQSLYPHFVQLSIGLPTSQKDNLQNREDKLTKSIAL